MSKAGGVDMPAKQDPHDFTTPSGRFPTVITRSMWDRLQKDGWDMRWYVVAKPIPTGVK